MPADPLAPLADLPGVAEAVDAARVACEGLRWHEAYRRRWREVRAEAGLRSARASAAVDGARVTLDVVRGLATGATSREPGGAALPGRADPHVDRALGAVRAAAAVERLMPELGARGSATLPPLPQLLARLHVAAATGWLDDDAVGRVRVAGAPQDLTGLGPAPVGDEVAARLDLLGRTVATTRAPALVVAAVVHGELLTLRPFAAGNGVVARATSRLLVTARGLDPTGSVVAEAGWAATPQGYLGAAAGFATGTPDGVAAWVRACAGAVVDGVARARHVADGVLAGRLPAD
ncbi:cell filamentation protein Fic [Cellulomonas sp. H30R-01]|uniref:Fic family protein n=1 Tax=Cellulomonas sp. H30R-01 TaxID=2704467 RepID=UPI00138B8D37|nr:Fic family protein [Cellulomonas sp. H30R-01]QHT56771.1 cell filamentation protein Fic [Cellulomonas sp. H30R-01]